ncbi:MAG TPA: LysR family transcriptional regulator [Candidatus Copromorpha excrementigallinarum]|uniref:LysR family transcriptional regulator n=1 Tax=Candidatus Allocopromorpha excrementigallinarum TaxID=2840742 RepID=A0A9D1L699_9FIRM|nr:LysR family transcriptional regulator [Candidatus Copromorpha excrementigallinarum]
MVELYQLRQFAAFASAGTLLEAAEALHLSQPALSRNMKKLEDELGISLFIRRKNRLELNENGKYVLTLVRELLADADALVEKAQNYDRKNRTISFGVCSPAPGWLISPLLGSLYPSKMLQTETAEEKVLLSGLEKGTYQLIALSHMPEGEQYHAKVCGRESLMFALPKGHRFARRKSLSFAEMDGENMILMNDIGFWDFVRTEKMPNSRFLTQSDRFSFSELVRSSSLPSFTTDLAKKYFETEDLRVEVPVSDPEASVTYCLICLKSSLKEFRALFSAL